MRVGLIIYGSLDNVSGGFLYDRKLVGHLRAAGHDVEVTPLPWRSYGVHLLDNFRTNLLDDLRRKQFDLLLQDELNHPSLFLLNRHLKHDVGYPIVSIVHHLRTSEGHPPHLRFFYRWVERRYLQGVDAFIYNSQTIGESVRSLLSDSPPSVVALPSGSRFRGLDPARIAGRASRQRPLAVVFVGNVIRRKGLHTLIAALAKLPPESAHLTVVGDTHADRSHVRAVRRQVERLGLPSQVEFAGRLADDGLASRLAAGDVLAVPSHYEGYGIAYLEGMAFGLPAIATTAGGARELIESGVNGFLVPPGDANALADRLHLLAADRRRLGQMSLAARHSFETHPKWAESMRAIEAFLVSLV